MLENQKENFREKMVTNIQSYNQSLKNEHDKINKALKFK